MTIKSNRVEEIFNECLYGEPELNITRGNDLESGEVPADAVVAHGVMNKVIFHPGRLEANRGEIIDMLLQLPEPFMLSKGGGWSFLQACQDRNGDQWTGLHLIMDQLFTLGIAIGRAKNLLPREMWSALPGGMPYLAVVDK